MLERVRRRVTYGNVTSTVALFIALGGTSYALVLPPNSVGSRELKPRSVGASELRDGVVKSREIGDRSVRLRDISTSARNSLRGRQGPAGAPGPPGPTLFAVVDSAGMPVSGGNIGSSPSGTNGRILTFPRSVAGCAYSATLAKVPGGLIEDPQPGSSINVAPSGRGVLVRTFDPNNQPLALPFHLIVAC